MGIRLFSVVVCLLACGTDDNQSLGTATDAMLDGTQDEAVDEPDATVSLLDATVASTGADMEVVSVSTDPSVLVINEVLYDPGPERTGDANGDGNRDPYEDEFIEFVNTGALPVNAGGLTIYDEQSFEQGTPRHLIPDNTIIQAGGALVVFGGGVPTGDFGGAIVQVANGYNQQLNINNSGETIRVFSRGEELLRFDCTPLADDPNAAYTRFPDITGDFTHHARIDFDDDGENDGTSFSPGRRSDGTSFID